MALYWPPQGWKKKKTKKQRIPSNLNLGGQFCNPWGGGGGFNVAAFIYYKILLLHLQKPTLN
jgi:hypothetical protein